MSGIFYGGGSNSILWAETRISYYAHWTDALNTLYTYIEYIIYMYIDLDLEHFYFWKIK